MSNVRLSQGKQELFKAGAHRNSFEVSQDIARNVEADVRHVGHRSVCYG